MGIFQQFQATVETGTAPASPTLTISAATQTITHNDSVDGGGGGGGGGSGGTNGLHEANGHVDQTGGDSEDEDKGPPRLPWELPDGMFAKIWHLLFFPLHLLFFVTIPDVRRPQWINWFPLTFFMCMAWIGAISYEVTWLITVIGYTINVPDTVMGLSFLAIGTSIPEVFSSLIVSKQVKLN
jgi:Ca2+/Na+ antiporter